MTRPRPRHPIRWDRGQKLDLWALGLMIIVAMLALIYLEKAL